jgi:hypothetical protein
MVKTSNNEFQNMSILFELLIIYWQKKKKVKTSKLHVVS